MRQLGVLNIFASGSHQVWSILSAERRQARFDRRHRPLSSIPNGFMHRLTRYWFNDRYRQAGDSVPS
jgi:hypothetical protein